MRYYTVKQISEILDTNPETVRRWIRDGKLEASQSSRKDGNIISEDAFNVFLKATPKYAGIVAGMFAMATLGISPAIGSIVGLIGAKMGKYVFSGDMSKENISAEGLKVFLEEAIEDSESRIKRNRNKIKKLQFEIEQDEENIQEIVKLFNSIDTTVKQPEVESVECDPTAARASDRK